MSEQVQAEVETSAEEQDLQAESNDNEQSQSGEKISQEDEARKYGWCPLDEWRGDEENWIDANAFLERKETLMPILKENNKRLEEKLTEFETKVSDLTGALKDQVEFNKRNAERAREDERKELEAQREQARQDKDFDAYDKATEELNKSKVAEQQNGVEPELAKWADEHPEIVNNKSLMNRHITLVQGLREENPNAPITELLEQGRKELIRIYPEKFENPNRKEAAAVEQPKQLNRGKKEKTINDLPAEDKKHLENLKRQIPDYTDEQFLADYQW